MVKYYLFYLCLCVFPFAFSFDVVPFCRIVLFIRLFRHFHFVSHLIVTHLVVLLLCLVWSGLVLFCFRLALFCLVDLRNTKLCFRLQSCVIGFRPSNHVVPHGSCGPWSHLLKISFRPLVAFVGPLWLCGTGSSGDAASQEL